MKVNIGKRKKTQKLQKSWMCVLGQWQLLENGFSKEELSEHYMISAAYPFSSIANPNDSLHARAVRLFAAINNDEIVTQPVHLDKRSTRPDQGLFHLGKPWVLLHIFISFRELP